MPWFNNPAGVELELFKAHHVRFAGATHLNVGTPIVTDEKSGTLSVWLHFKGADGVRNYLLANEGGVFGFSRAITTNLIGGAGFNPSITQVWAIGLATATVAASGWIHYMASWDMNVPLARNFLNDTFDEGNRLNTLDGITDYTRAHWNFLASSVGADQIDADVAELWMDKTYLDVQVEANRRKFINPSGKPVFLGPNGEGPTGSPPWFCFNNPETTGWEVNKGTGGTTALVGDALVDGEAGNGPSD